MTSGTPEAAGGQGGDGEGLRHRPRRLRRAARLDADVLRAGRGGRRSPRAPKLPKTMDLVRNFLFDHGILGTNAPSVDVVGMSFPGRLDARRRQQRQAALRPDLHGGGGGRERSDAARHAGQGHGSVSAIAEADGAVARPLQRRPKVRLRLINATVSRGGGLVSRRLAVPGRGDRLSDRVGAKGWPSTPTTSCCRRRRRCGRPSWQLATVPDKRSGDLILWVDTYASLLRLFAGVGVATLAALLPRHRHRLHPARCARSSRPSSPSSA